MKYCRHHCGYIIMIRSTGKLIMSIDGVAHPGCGGIISFIG